APFAGSPTEASHDCVHRLYEVRLVHRLRQHPTGAARVRQGAQEHIGRLCPRSVPAFEPVPLDLVARGVIDLDRISTLYPRARLAVRAQARQADLTGEAHVRTAVTETDDLVVKCRGPQMRVVDKAGGEVRAVVGQSIRPRQAPDTRSSFAVQVRANRLAVTLEMAGDGRDGPSPLEQSICFHVFSH